MLIEFSCPMCQTALAIQKKTAGGQVNCPKCQKLILLPAESPLPRPDPDTPPYQNGRRVSVREVTRAISTSVEPYRRDLETKTNLLNDAVEMVKVRNERIKEVETLMLNTQSELWALEVDFETLQAEEVPQTRAWEAEKRHLEEKKNTLKARLANLVEHSEHLDDELKAYRELVTREGGVLEKLDGLHDLLAHRETRLREDGGVVEEARILLGTARDRLLKCHASLDDRERRRREMEQLVHASSEDMQRALDERNQWKKQAEELEKKAEEWEEEREQLEARLSEAEHLLEEGTRDRESAKTLRKEMEENLELLRARIEEERASHKQLLEEREQVWRSGSEKKIRSLEKKLEQTAADLEEAEAKRLEALDTQRQLAEQNMRAEKERTSLKRRLQEALDQLEQREP